jgi:predicted MFS family arabinose efflux permease
MMQTTEDAFRRPYRWVVLAVYTLVAGVSQMLWLNFAPLLSQIQQRFGVSELLASTLVLVFPLLYVLLSLPAGAMIDRKGYRYTVGLGAAIMAVFACLRIYDASFWVLLAGQVGIAVAQPFVVNGISKLVTDWFSAEQGAMATGLGTMGMFIGMAVGMAVSPALVESMGMRGAMVAFAVITVVLGGAFIALARENPAAVDAEAAEAAPAGGFRTLVRQRDLVLVFALSFLGLGFFNGLTTWLEGILAPNGINAVDAGLVGGLLIMGGIVGAVVIPTLSDRFRRRKPFVILCTVGALAALYPLCTSSNYTLLLVLGGVLGFFFLPAYALLLEMSSELAGPRLAGSATGILMLTGNAGGVIVIIAMQLVKGEAPTWHSSVLLMLALLGVALVLAGVVSETFQLRQAEAEG